MTGSVFHGNAMIATNDRNLFSCYEQGGLATCSIPKSSILRLPTNVEEAFRSCGPLY